MRKKIFGLLVEKGDPPSLPEVLITLEKKINDPDCDIYEVCALIESDPVLAGNLMKLSNTVFFGGGRGFLDDLPSVVLRVGVKMVLELAYTTILPGMFSKYEEIDLNQFWRHSLWVSFLTQSLGEETNLPEEERKASYLSGLMHDIGILIFFYLVSDEYALFLKEGKDSPEFLGKLEKNKFGIDHAELGARFIEKWWPVSPIVVKAVAGHQLSRLTEETSVDLSFLVCVANQLAHENGIGNGIKGRFENEPSLNQKYLDILGIPPKKIEILLNKTQESLEKIETLLE